jgi:mannose-6-phosphate isomerase-like protein (cupin superfamily)
MEKVNIKDKLQKFQDLWSPKIVGELNDSYIKLAKFKGEFVWHRHDDADELFLVAKGKLTIRFRDQDVILNEGEFFIVPKGIEHLTKAEEEVHVILIESKTVINTGDVVNEKTVSDLHWI